MISFLAMANSTARPVQSESSIACGEIITRTTSSADGYAKSICQRLSKRLTGLQDHQNGLVGPSIPYIRQTSSWTTQKLSTLITASSTACVIHGACVDQVGPIMHLVQSSPLVVGTDCI